MLTPTVQRFGCLLGLAGLLWLPQLQAASVERPDGLLRALLVDAINASDSFQDRFDAEVWLSDMSNRLASRIADTRERLELLRYVHVEATESYDRFTYELV